jgi:ATP/maltotriose-dependent transcriptional regulator MalT
LFRELGNLTLMAYAMSTKGHALAVLGDSVQAQALAEEGLRIFREVGDRRGIAVSLKDLARFALFAGDANQAITPLRRALELFQSLGDLFMISICVEILAGMLILRATPTTRADADELARTDEADERHLDAVRFYAWADLQRAQTGLVPPPEMRGAPERDVAWLREYLGEAAFSQSWTEGRAMSVEEVTEYALATTAAADPAASDATPGPTFQAGTAHPVPSGDGDVVRLTSREWEVAALIVQGRMNREIAEALVLSERTVDSHVRNIMGKLEVNSRAQVAAWAVQHGLARCR